jgi:hypothetical protein
MVLSECQWSRISFAVLESIARFGNVFGTICMGYRFFYGLGNAFGTHKLHALKRLAFKPFSALSSESVFCVSPFWVMQMVLMGSKLEGEVKKASHFLCTSSIDPSRMAGSSALSLLRAFFSSSTGQFSGRIVIIRFVVKNLPFGNF